METVTSTVDGDDVGMMEQAIKDGAGGGDVAQEFTPFLNGTIGGHHCRAVFVATHDVFQEGEI